MTGVCQWCMSNVVFHLIFDNEWLGFHCTRNLVDEGDSLMARVSLNSVGSPVDSLTCVLIAGSLSARFCLKDAPREADPWFTEGVRCTCVNMDGSSTALARTNQTNENQEKESKPQRAVLTHFHNHQKRYWHISCFVEESRQRPFVHIYLLHCVLNP